MKWATASLVILLAAGLIGLGVHAVSLGVGAGYEISGLILLSALTEMPISESLDVRAQIGFATPEIAGLMLVTADLLTHWLISPFDPFVGLGIGAALTPPPYSTGFVVEGVGGLRIAPFDGVQLLLQVRYLLRRAGNGWHAGPVFEGGLLVQF